MLLCLILAALLGFIIGWALRALICHNKISELEASWESRLAAAVAAGGPVKRDDLKRIEGIGPKIEKLLNKDEIYTWDELAQAPLDRLRKILGRAGEHYRIHDPKSWPDQAKLASEGRWEELDELQEVLLGGRST
jgi:predicted flap endonuclease-1-like 5' DNA nuclease